MPLLRRLKQDGIKFREPASKLVIEGFEPFRRFVSQSVQNYGQIASVFS